MIMKERLKIISLLISNSITVPLLLLTLLSACVTARIEDNRLGMTGLNDGEGIVIMAKSYHLGNETENKFISCISRNMRDGASGLRIISNQEFVDSLFPWFEPRTAPANMQSLPLLMNRPEVASIIKNNGIRYIIWVDGNTNSSGGGGNLSCAVGPGGAGCFGFAWWSDDAKYEASVWDLSDFSEDGNVTADYSGTSFLPAVIIPIPFIARTQNRACQGLSEQLKLFIVG